MENSEIITKLQHLKEEVTNLGHLYIKNRLPIALDRLGVVAKPFIDLEKMFDQSINDLKLKK